MDNKAPNNKTIISKASNNKLINNKETTNKQINNNRSIYDLYLDSIMRHNKIKVVSTEHDYDSEKMMTYFNKQKLKKKNFKKE